MSNMMDTTKAFELIIKCHPFDDLVEAMAARAYWPIEYALERVAAGEIRDAGIVASKAVLEAIIALQEEGYTIVKESK